MRRAGIVIAIVMVTTGAAWLWGQTNPPAPDGAADGTLVQPPGKTDMEEKQDTGSAEPGQGPDGAKAAAPEPDDTNGAGTAEVIAGRTFWGLTTAEWGQQTGTRAPAPVGRSGRSTCWDGNGVPIQCRGTGHDGELQSGVTWPSPRFVDHGDGTVSDRLTGLIWLQDASCADLAGTDGGGRANWTTALSAAAALADGSCGLSDGSQAGSWHLPSVNELQSLIDYGFHSPALSDAAGSKRWTTDGDAFVGVQAPSYWTSSTSSSRRKLAWQVSLYNGVVKPTDKSFMNYVWPVRSNSGAPKPASTSATDPARGPAGG